MEVEAEYVVEEPLSYWFM